MATTKKTTTTTKPKPKEIKRRSVMAGHEEEFARVILAPKLIKILVEHKGHLTMTALAKKYNKKYGAGLSSASLKKFCNLMGWKYERVPMWTGIEPPTDAAPVDLGAHARDVLTAQDTPDAEESNPVGVVGGPLPGQKDAPSAFEKDVIG